MGLCNMVCILIDRTAIKMYSTRTLHSKIVNQTGSADPAQAPGGQYKVWAGRINDDIGEDLDQHAQDIVY